MGHLAAAVVFSMAFALEFAGGQSAVTIVADGAEVRRAVGFQIDGSFTPMQEEAEAPRSDLDRYLRAERMRSKNGPKSSALWKIQRQANRYIWYCGGYVKGSERYQYCSFLLPQVVGRGQLRQKRFPVVDDGGISVCHCFFSMKLGRIVRLEWNGEA